MLGKILIARSSEEITNMVIKEKIKMNKSGKRWESNTHTHTRYNLIKRKKNRNYPFRV